MSDVLKYAKWYLSHGFSCFPVIPARADSEGKDLKRPACKWEAYQKRLPTTEEIDGWWGKYPDNRIGIATGGISSLLVVDCDDEAAHRSMEDEILPESFKTPIVKSPKGWHYWFKHEPGYRNAVKVDGIGMDIRSEGGFIVSPPSGGLNGKGYSFLKGYEPWNVQVCEMPDSLRKVLSKNKGGSSYNVTQITDITQITLSQGKRDEALFHLANYLVKSGMPEADIRFYLRFFASKCEPPFPPEEAEAKIKSAMQRQERVKRNLTQEIRDLIGITRHNISITWALQNITQITFSDRAKITTIFHRLAKEGIIEPVQNRIGEYRIVERDTPEIKWWEADMEELPLRLPFDLQEYVRIMPKTLSVIAGSQDAGKTALLLNLAYQNASKHKIVYLSSEMDANELASRLIMLDPFEERVLRKIEFRDRSSKFVDVIEPDAVNIIDYYEISDKFYIISEEFKAIRNKLNKGVAFIALQKDANKELGRGASFGMEKPRLYLTLDRDFEKGNTLRVQKAKGWRNSHLNPNGLMVSFFLHGGINLHAKGAWEHETVDEKKNRYQRKI